MQPPRTLRPAWAEIDLDALRRNLDRLARRAGDRSLRAVVKADAYGHGAVEVSRALERYGLDRFAVALVEEGVELRQAGIAGEILVLNPCHAGQCDLVRRHDLVPTVSSLEQLQMWIAATAAIERRQPVHLKVDTGMHRLGIAPRELPGALAEVRSSRLELAGLMSHLADADLATSSRTGEQIERFSALVAGQATEDSTGVDVHIANSAGLLHHTVPEATGVRLGLSLYGYDPARRAVDLEPVMTVRARIVQIHLLAPGERVGYGGRWTAVRESRVGTVPVGYGDGYPWRLGGKGEALVDGRRVPVVGAVSMDMLALDLTDTNAASGDEVVLLGRDGEQAITADELAERADSLSYSVLCDFGLRLPRQYMENGTPMAHSSRHERPSPTPTDQR